MRYPLYQITSACRLQHCGIHREIETVLYALIDEAFGSRDGSGQCKLVGVMNRIQDDFNKIKITATDIPLCYSF